MSQLKVRKRESFLLSLLFYLGFQWIGRGPPTLGREVSFTQPTDSNVNLTQEHPH